MYVARASEKLRGRQSMCGAIHVFIPANPFRQPDDQYSNGLTIPFAEPTDGTRALAGAARVALHLPARNRHPRPMGHESLEQDTQIHYKLDGVVEGACEMIEIELRTRR